MKKQSSFFLAVFVLLMVGVGLGGCEGKITIKGKIKNMQDYNMQAAYFQLVAWDPENKDSVPKATAAYDIDNRLLSVELLSDLPKREIMDNGNLIYKLENLKAGRYVMFFNSSNQKTNPLGIWVPVRFYVDPWQKKTPDP